jgi:hypothetical protein
LILFFTAESCSFEFVLAILLRMVVSKLVFNALKSHFFVFSLSFSVTCGLFRPFGRHRGGLLGTPVCEKVNLCGFLVCVILINNSKGKKKRAISHNWWVFIFF